MNLTIVFLIPRKVRCLCLLLFGITVSMSAADSPTASTLETDFKTPPQENRPETWFHLIGGNVSKTGLTKDLEAVANAGLQGIQLFHGSGRVWPGVEPQIACLSSEWEGMIGHVANETKRLGLRFTMQNCPGWAMSGGPWITPDKAMRHLISSRTQVTGGQAVSVTLERPQPSNQDWRDYRDIAVLAFPTPEGDGGGWLEPVEVKSNREGDWTDLLAARKNAEVNVTPGGEPAWLQVTFAKATTLRSIELPPIEPLMARRNFDPDSYIAIQIPDGNGWMNLVRHAVPRGTWQDRQPEYPLVLAVPDADSARYRIVFENKHPMTLSYLRLSPSARVHNWRGQAGYALRSLERAEPVVQSRTAWVVGEAVVDLSDKMNAQGQLAWDAPAGQWTLLRFGHVNTGVKNKPAPPEATGFECDKLSPVGAEQHFAGYIGKVSRSGGPADDGRLQGMLIDSWECFTQTWTPAMEQEFAKRRGYALRRWLPALAGYVVDDPRTSERFLRDWRATISDLLVGNYFGRLAELARARGLALSFETAIGDVSPGDILEYQSRADIPMCEFWQPNDPHNGGLETKPISPTTSAAHIYGKRRVAAEAFTSHPNKWDTHPFALKNLADRHFAQGVTHLVFHTYTHNPLDRVPGTSFGGAIGTPFLRGQTWWQHMPLFAEYLARCQFMLEQGQPVADVLWYLGDDLDHKPRQDQPFPNGYQFDYLNADALLHRLSVLDGQLRNPEGTTWRMLWLPREQCRRLTPATLAKLKVLLDAGATVIGEAPEVNPTLSGGKQADEQFAALVKQLWGGGTQARGDRRIGTGRLLWGDDLAANLKTLGFAPDVVGAHSADWCHRRVGDSEVYFVAADRASPLNANLRFRAVGQPEFWNPLTGERAPAAVFRQDDAGTSIAMQLPAGGSVFVVFRPSKAAPAFERIAFNGTILADATDTSRVDTAAPFPHFGLSRSEPLQPWVEPLPLTGEIIENSRQLLAWSDGQFEIRHTGEKPLSMTVAGTRTIPLERGWSLFFPPGWDAPSSLDLGELKPWSELPDKAASHFSGSATYRTTFRLEALKPDERARLDLGRVSDIAELRINGRKVAALWTAPFRVDITPHLKIGDNELEIEVSNSWHNRLAYDAGLPEAQRRTWTFNPPGANAALEVAGLSGPVSIRIGKIRNLPAP